jgi:hypothetical protein
MRYQPVNLIHVGLDFGEITQKVGRLALVNRQIYFEYHPAFLTSGLNLSPFKLPLMPGAIPCEDRAFEGLFGVFNDSLPDGWGRLLLDRYVRKLGRAPEQIMRATLELTRNVQELETILRLASFNVFAHNRDDHGKNFSFLMKKNGDWSVAPAYDLTF